MQIKARVIYNFIDNDIRAAVEEVRKKEVLFLVDNWEIVISTVLAVDDGEGSYLSVGN